ncbi:SRPBCC family protein [Phenylobacterium sp.]|uniref:SRPBCC family protein n=1 Tax=Phenylobacterium sp. TaxID=1871053 RepID=UPI0035AF4FB5
MSEYGVSPAPGVVRFERLLPGPVERIWAYLVDPEKRALWFAGGPMDLKPGGRLVLKFRHSNLSDTPDAPPERYREVHDVGFESELKVVEADPPRRVAFTFDEGPDPSIVTIELTAEGDQVRLVLTHANLKSRQGMLDVSGGWHAHLEVLAHLAAGKPRPPFWAMWARFQDYDRRLPA